MSQNRQVLAGSLGAVLVGDFSMPSGSWFDWHHHPDDQLVWAATGVALVRVADAGGTWVLPSGRALWLPAGTEHTTGASVPTNLRSLYLSPQRSPVRWSAPTVLAVSALLRELIGHLSRPGLPRPARLRAEAVLFDLLAPLPTTVLEVPEPSDQRLLPITGALRANPADGRALGEWGQYVGASARNLARLFVADTGLTFGQWRTHLRLEAALPLLANGLAVSRVAVRVGYATPSAFVAAFHRAVGVPPGAYFGASTSGD